MPNLRGVSRSFDRWRNAQDEASVIAGTDVRAWFAAAGFVAFIVATTAFVPGLRESFHIRSVAAVLSFLPVFIWSTVLHPPQSSPPRLTPWVWLHCFIGTSMLQVYVASLMSWSAMPGAAAFATLFLLTVAYHGYGQLVTPKEPFLAISTVFAGIVAMAINHDPEHLSLFAVVIPAALVIELLAGTHAARQRGFRDEIDQFRAAVAAQILERQSGEVQELSERLVSVLGHSHDIKNALASVNLGADAIELLVSQERQPAEELKRASVRLKEDVQRVRAMLQTAQDGRPTAPEAERIDVHDVVQSVVEQVATRFQGIRVAIGEPPIDGLAVQVRGGSLNLHRVFLNIVTNACEGNGERTATEVVIKAGQTRVGSAIALEVEDNGPGFDEELLHRPIEGLTTTKRTGTGLGLYTSERLVRASGGVIERANRSAGGAVVRVILPSATK